MQLKSISAAAFLLSLTIAPLGFSSEFEYFSKGVDFWNEVTSPPVPASSQKPVEEKGEPTAAKAEEVQKDKFPWEKHLDPKNKEFFKEGEYTPPEPFMELVRNPSDENLKMWFAYMDKKNELSTRLHERMSEYLAKNGGGIPNEQKQSIAQLAPVNNQKVEPRNYRLRMYFSSTCPHCQKMMGTLSNLQDQGFYIEGRQIDRGSKGLMAAPFPVEFASPQETQQKNIQSVPLLLIGDLKKKLVYRLTGYQTTDAVISAIQQQSGGN